MKKTRFYTIALTAIVSIGLAYGAALAQDADNDMSVYNWGPWGRMITPAAGPAPAFLTQLPEGFDYQSALNPQRVVPSTVVVPPVEPPIQGQNQNQNRNRHGNGNNGNGGTY